MASLGVNFPALIVIFISLVIGLLMVIVFGYTSDQKAIHIAKDQLKAHLLALRLFQDQIGVVLRSYARIVVATGTYLRLAFKPLLFVIVPITLLIVQVDRYLGLTPVQAGHAFLIKARLADDSILNDAALQLPEGLSATAPAVHVPAENEIAWRVVAARDGKFNVSIEAPNQKVSKSLVVGPGLPRLSEIRLRGRLWERLFVSAEPALPAGGTIESVEVQYPARDIAFAGLAWNWIWLFFVLSLIAGFIFKSILGIEI
ncbi:MAG TPA: hypothetical protein VMH04_15115 [Candidatus Solibacter sp.]|nr:hypothetical protein [Candidatus Solibacter sp.]